MAIRGAVLRRLLRHLGHLPDDRSPANAPGSLSAGGTWCVPWWIFTGSKAICRMAAAVIDNGRTQGGSTCDIVIADAFAKGLQGIDYEEAYRAMVKKPKCRREEMTRNTAEVESKRTRSWAMFRRTSNARHAYRRVRSLRCGACPACQRAWWQRG